MPRSFKRSGEFANRASLVARAYENNQLRPLARMVRNVAFKFTSYRPDGLEEVGSYYPTAAFRDGTGRVEVVMASRTHHQVIAFWASDLKLLLDSDPFTPVELAPDPSATPNAIIAMRQKGLVPLAWEEVL